MKQEVFTTGPSAYKSEGSKSTFNPRFWTLVAFVAALAFLRVVVVKSGEEFANFTPIGAMALFGGAYFTKNWKALLVPLLALLASDVIIQQMVYGGEYGAFLYKGWYVVYGVFLLIVLFGNRLIKKVNVKNVLLGAVSASLAHWLITDFGVWLGGIDVTTGLPFTKDVSGFIKCYALALPFLKNFLLGTLFYSALLFGSFELAQYKFSVLKRQPVA
ncbi:MAG: hypothetical protein COA57_15550 [Flavobacteriales bacterium]|nr:MAG: hypothetical protein COA57_15550 [Flavobacteriales bacterium]